MAVFVNTLLEQIEHHRSDTALPQLCAVMCCALLPQLCAAMCCALLPQLCAVMCCALLPPFLYLGTMFSTLNVITTALLPQTPLYPVKCLRVIGNHPRRTPTSHLNNSLKIEPIPFLIHRLTDKFFAHCPSHPKPPVQQVRNYTLADRTNLYRKYKHNLGSIYCFN
jgi:hypothetical protein